ncbi:MAG TPA: hypothetical protein VHU91_07150 [Mycobacteriales bacterium]|nr:hypothetical protein [Mycobacteriales bacterium]
MNTISWMLSDVLIRRLLIFNVPAAFIGFARRSAVALCDVLPPLR